MGPDGVAGDFLSLRGLFSEALYFGGEVRNFSSCKGKYLACTSQFERISNPARGSERDGVRCTDSANAISATGMSGTPRADDTATDSEPISVKLCSLWNAWN